VELEEIAHLLLFVALAGGLSFLVSWLLSKLHRILVFVIPVLLTLLTAILMMIVFVENGGLGTLALFILGVYGAIAATVSWTVAVIVFFWKKNR